MARTRGTNYAQLVRKYFTERPNETISKTTLSRELKMTSAQVVSSIGYLRKSGYALETVERGQKWRYKFITTKDVDGALALASSGGETDPVNPGTKPGAVPKSTLYVDGGAEQRLRDIASMSLKNWAEAEADELDVAVYYQIGTTMSGTPLVKGEDGRVFRLEEV